MGTDYRMRLSPKKGNLNFICPYKDFVASLYSLFLCVKHLFMQKKIKSALISVFYKDGLEPIVRLLQQLGITIYSTGGTEKFIKDLGIDCVPV